MQNPGAADSTAGEAEVSLELSVLMCRLMGGFSETSAFFYGDLLINESRCNPLPYLRQLVAEDCLTCREGEARYGSLLSRVRTESPYAEDVLRWLLAELRLQHGARGEVLPPHLVAEHPGLRELLEKYGCRVPE